jgi:hypothetical protein
MEPKVYIDAKNDFASIKIKEGIEAKSYEKDGFIFCEDNGPFRRHRLQFIPDT